jgi:hypothetical protein
MISHWVLVDRELRSLAVKIQCVALATEIRAQILVVNQSLFISMISARDTSGQHKGYQ